MKVIIIGSLVLIKLRVPSNLQSADVGKRQKVRYSKEKVKLGE